MPFEKVPFSLPDLYRLHFQHSADLSPDGTKVVCSVSDIDSGKEEEYIRLWLVDLKSDLTRPLTFGSSQDIFPHWSPDGKQIVFLSDRAGVAQLYLLSLDGGEARPLTDLPQGVSSEPIWSPDGKWIAFCADPTPGSFNPEKPYRLNRTIFRFDHLGFMDGAIQTLYTIPSQGGEPQVLFREDAYCFPLEWSPDSRKLLYVSLLDAVSPDTGCSLKEVDLSGNCQEIRHKWRYLYDAKYLSDGRIVLEGAQEGAAYGTKRDVWILDKNRQDLECRTPSLKTGVCGLLQPDMPCWMILSMRLCLDENEQNVMVRVQDGGNVHVYRVALIGPENWSPILTGERSIIPIKQKNDALLCLESDAHSPGELVVANPDGTQERKITHFNDELIAQRRLPEIRHLIFPGEDGVPVEGWLMLPATAVKPPYPTLLAVHGGPDSGWGNVFCFDFQMFAGAGYAVLYINQRGSTGYGTEFAKQIIGDWGHLDYTDLIRGVDHAIELGLTDPERLGVWGISGGGFSSCWIVGQTDRFKAAVPENPVTNWFSFYGTSGEGPGFTPATLGGKPHEIPDIYLRCSPIIYAHRCTTPTLLIQADDDFCCPAEQSEQFYTILKNNDCIVEMLRIPGNSHKFAMEGTPDVRMAESQALLEWMNRYVVKE